MRARSRRLLLIAFLWWLGGVSSGGARGAELPRGEIIPRVVCQQNTEHSYALYLPSNYTTEKKWPVLYAFDPGARGAVPVELYREAAEKYGYVVIGSNTSRNWMTTSLSTVLQTLWEDTHARLSLDERRVYTTGFSGGARVAATLGYAVKAAGVIACGAGFPAQITPSKETPFVLFGLAGSDDFNAPEVQQLGRSLNELKIPNRIVIFAGGHAWAPQENCAEALEWMELQAMKSGLRPRDDLFVESLLKRATARAHEREAANDLPAAFSELTALAADFQGLAETGEFEARAKQLREAKEVKQSLRQEADLERRQRELINQLFGLSEATGGTDEPVSSFAALKTLIGDLRKKSAAEKDNPDRRLARRVLNGFYISIFDEANNFHRQKSFAKAASRFEIAAELMPQNPFVFYRLAGAYTLDGRKKKALAALRQSLANGFKDAAALEKDEDFNALRNEPAYAQMLDELKGKAP